MLKAEQIATLHSALLAIELDSALLWSEELAFFRHYLQSLNATLPPQPHSPYKPKTNGKPTDFEDDHEIWPDDQGAGYLNVEPTAEPSEADLEKAAESKSRAAHLAEEGNLDEALKEMTGALRCKPESAMYWAARAAIYLQAKKPACAIKDSNRALEFNPDSAHALRVRGTAFRHLGQWESAADDLNAANQIDFDEASVPLANLATERANRIRHERHAKEQKHSGNGHAPPSSSAGAVPNIESAPAAEENVA